MRAFLFGTERIAATEKENSTPKPEKSKKRAFWSEKPSSYVVWPETEEKYCALMRFGVPFVFVGKHYGATISGKRDGDFLLIFFFFFFKISRSLQAVSL
jgi:hypothetical protein